MSAVLLWPLRALVCLVGLIFLLPLVAGFAVVLVPMFLVALVMGPLVKVRDWAKS